VAAHRLSTLICYLPAGGLAGSRSSGGAFWEHPNREGLPLAARPEPFAAFPSRALSIEESAAVAPDNGVRIEPPAADAWSMIERGGELRARELFERRCPVLER
jgi:hypothetical protein